MVNEKGKMNRKEREVKVIAGIAFAAILIASIFAIVAPTTMAGTNGVFSPDEEPASSIRIYGDVQPQGNAPGQYVTSKELFDPTVIPTDSITYNPAIIEESHEEGEPYYRILIGNADGSPENGREKILLRSWYEPCGQYNGPGVDNTHPTINMEYTYMLMNTLYLPAYGTAPNTQFLIPTCEIDTQTGLGAWKDGTNVDNITTLASVSGPAVAPSGETVLGEIRLEKLLALPEGDIVQFFDHTVELTNITISGEFVLKVSYAGNAQDDSEEGGVSLEDGETIYFDRHNNEYTTANHDPAAGNIRTWYVSRDTDILIVGKELHWSDVFYVDAVRYEVTAVEVVDTDGDDGVVDAFEYITLRTKLPKGVGSVRDESMVSSQFIDCIEPAELIPLLPPFNMNHDMVDDIDIPLWTSASEERDWTRPDYAGTELDPDGDWHWIAYDVNERVIDNLDPLELTYIAGEVEGRYSTNLLEKLREDWEVGGPITESWTNFDIQSLPDQYTEFVLPALPDYYTLPIAGEWPIALDGDYLITTSLIAPQATGDLHDNKRGTIPGDPNEQRVAFSYDPKDGEDGNDFYVYYDEELKMGTLNIYGNGSDSTFGITNSCNIEQYESWEEPFDPTAIRTASITFDAAILQYSPEYPMKAQNESVDMKEYLRVWYVPEYEFYGWHEMIGLTPAIVIETTYMLIDSQDKKPWHADVGSGFPFPIVSDPTTDQIGLDSFENPGVESVKENLVRRHNRKIK
ncbi:hypothetical protein C5S36_08355 [Candidatus Methanophagaceae archaeon]|nr:hypothetical protein C5S36_08355 [Methanophagales archaeon]